MGAAGAGARRVARRRLSGAELSLLAIPDAARPRLLVSRDPAAVRFALERFDRATVPWRLARLAGRLGLGPSVLARRFPAWTQEEPPLEELRALIGENGPCVAQMGSSGDFVVFLLRGSEPTAVAKVSRDRGRLEHEARVLRELGDVARAAGADAPRPLAEHTLDGLGVLVETPIAGRPLVRTLAGAPGRLPRALGGIAAWLEHWHRSTARPLELTGGLLEREVLGPAKTVAGSLGDGGAYLAALERVCSRAEGIRMPLVAAHQDLTSHNVLDRRGRLGIVDWEHAREDGFPLTDLFYAAADLAAAAHRDHDRPEGFEDCFLTGGRWAALVERLEQRLRDAVGLSSEAAAVCFHACWIHHAANELRKSDGRPGPFVALAVRAVQVRP